MICLKKSYIVTIRSFVHLPLFVCLSSYKTESPSAISDRQYRQSKPPAYPIGQWDSVAPRRCPKANSNDLLLRRLAEVVVQACVKEAKWRPSTTRLPIPFVWAGERKNNPNFSHRKPSHDPQNWDIGASLRPKLLVYSTTWEPSKNSLMGVGIRAPSWLWRRKLTILNNKGISRGLGWRDPWDSSTTRRCNRAHLHSEMVFRMPLVELLLPFINHIPVC